MKILNLFLILVMLGFGLMVAKNAQALGNNPITTAPCEGTALTSGTVPYIDNSSQGYAASEPGAAGANMRNFIRR